MVRYEIRIVAACLQKCIFYVTSTPLLNLTVRMNLRSKSKHSRFKKQCLQVYFKIFSRIVNTFLEMSGQVWRVGNEGQQGMDRETSE